MRCVSFGKYVACAAAFFFLGWVCATREPSNARGARREGARVNHDAPRGR